MPERNEPEQPVTETPVTETPDATLAATPADAPTVAIAHTPRATPTRVGPGTPPPPGVTAAPAQVAGGGSPKGRRRWPWILVALIVLAAAAAGIGFLAGNVGGNSAEDDVRATITGFTDAVDRGDLAALRAGTCGELAAYYQQVTDADFAAVHQSANSDRAVPILDGIDAVSVTDDTALAQVTVHMANDPASTSVRSFALERQDGVWKVCS